MLDRNRKPNSSVKKYLFNNRTFPLDLFIYSEQCQSTYCENEYHIDSFIHAYGGVWTFDSMCSLLGCNILK